MKEDVRYKLKIKRRYFEGYRRTVADECIAADFLAAYGTYESFFLYRSFGTEAGTDLLIAELIRADKQVYLPRVEGNRILPVPYGETRKGAFGIEEPVGAAYDGTPEVTVTPLLAVNARGFRLGYGGGFYDRYFREHATIRVGIGYAFQQEEFKEDVWDEPLHAFLCERGITYFGNENR